MFQPTLSRKGIAFATSGVLLLCISLFVLPLLRHYSFVDCVDFFQGFLLGLSLPLSGAGIFLLSRSFRNARR